MYTIIFMDLEMPIMDGYEATMKIREIEKSNKYHPTLICALSAYTNDGKDLYWVILEIKQRCIKCGMDDCLAKPLNMEQMLKMISNEFEKLQNK